MDFGIYNFGKQPSLILSQKYKLVIVQDTAYNKFDNLVAFKGLNLAFIPGGGNATLTFSRREVMTLSEFTGLSNKSYFIFLIGEIIYSNNINNVRRKYQFVVKADFTMNLSNNQNVSLEFNKDSTID